MPSFSQTAVSGVPVDRSNAFNDTICGHRFGLTNAPMQLSNVCQVHFIELHASESRVSVLPQVNTIVHDGFRFKLGFRLFEEISLGEFPERGNFAGSLSSGCWVFAERDARQDRTSGVSCFIRGQCRYGA